MTVTELIAKLRELPQDARVVIDGYEGGVEDVAMVTTVILVNVRDIADTMEGNHELREGLDDQRPADETAVYLPRRGWPND